MESIFNQLLKETVTPLLKAAGFKKTGMNYYRQLSGMVYLVNVQKSHGNSSVETGFYINCGMHSLEMDEAMEKTPNPMPKEYQCHFRRRIRHISPQAEDKYVVNAATDLPTLQSALKQSLSEVLAFFDFIPDTMALVRLLAQQGTEHHFDVFRYCLQMGYAEEAQMLKAHVRKVMGEERWTEFFEGRFGEIEGGFLEF